MPADYLSAKRASLSPLRLGIPSGMLSRRGLRAGARKHTGTVQIIRGGTKSRGVGQVSAQARTRADLRRTSSSSGPSMGRQIAEAEDRQHGEQDATALGEGAGVTGSLRPPAPAPTAGWLDRGPWRSSGWSGSDSGPSPTSAGGNALTQISLARKPDRPTR